MHFLCIEPKNKGGSQNLYKWKVFEGAVFITILLKVFVLF